MKVSHFYYRYVARIQIINDVAKEVSEMRNEFKTQEIQNTKVIIKVKVFNINATSRRDNHSYIQ